MNMKVLYITTIGKTMDFFKSFVKRLLDEGNIVDIGTNENNGDTPVRTYYRDWGCKVYHIDTSRSPYSTGNLRAVKQIREIMRNNQYDIVHCHTPLASVATRLACRSLRKKGLRVFYTVHGFHFYDGAPLKNWLIFYPIEKWLSRYTDVLITINKEDYGRASKKFHAKKIVYVPGVGMDIEKFKPDKEIRERKRKELGLTFSEFMVLSVGELNENKNHATVIKALCGLERVHYFIAGAGGMKNELKRIGAECGINLHLLGFRYDVDELYNAADVYVLPSHREGLNVSLMEAMSCGCNCLCSDIRGNRDLIVDKEFRVDSYRVEEWREKIEIVMNGASNKAKCMDRIKLFSRVVVDKKMDDLYQGYRERAC